MNINDFDWSTLEPTEIVTEDKEVEAEFDIIVVGGGIAGLTAALYSARAGFSTLVLTGEIMSAVDFPGGQLMLTDSIVNYPGFTGKTGPELIETVMTQAESQGAALVEGRVESIDFNFRHNYHRVLCTDGRMFGGSKVILATGAIARRLGVGGENALYGRGVSSCATCDGEFAKGKKVAVIGGGDVAVEDALYLTKHAEHVYVIHRRDILRSQLPAARTLKEHPKVTMIWNSTVSEILGDTSVEGLVYETGPEVSSLDVEAVFVAIGHEPQNELAFDGSGGNVIDVHESGYLMAWGTRTSVPGVFVAGDIVDDKYRQAITAAASGAQAAIDATRELGAKGVEVDEDGNQIP